MATVGISCPSIHLSSNCRRSCTHSHSSYIHRGCCHSVLNILGLSVADRIASSWFVLTTLEHPRRRCTYCQRESKHTLVRYRYVVAVGDVRARNPEGLEYTLGYTVLCGLMKAGRQLKLNRSIECTDRRMMYTLEQLRVCLHEYTSICHHCSDSSLMCMLVCTAHRDQVARGSSDQ